MALMMAENRRARIRSRLLQAEADRDVRENELIVMIHYEGRVVLPRAVPEKLSPDTSAYNAEQSMPGGALDARIRYSQATLRAESWKLVPSFSIGWFTQSLDREKPFTGWQYGISLPVWFWAPAGRIQAAKTERAIAVNDRENTLHHLDSRYFSLITEYKSAARQLAGYEPDGLERYATMMADAGKRFSSGTIDLYEYLFITGEAFEIQLEYLEALHKHNLLVIQIRQLLGK
jgi:cobalt-zinc-cadmium resistance protein CzcA